MSRTGKSMYTLKGYNNITFVNEVVDCLRKQQSYISETDLYDKVRERSGIRYYRHHSKGRSGAFKAFQARLNALVIEKIPGITRRVKNPKSSRKEMMILYDVVIPSASVQEQAQPVKELVPRLSLAFIHEKMKKLRGMEIELNGLLSDLSRATKLISEKMQDISVERLRLQDTIAADLR